MLKFNIKDDKSDEPKCFGELDAGDTFVYYVAYQDAGLDTFRNLVFIKVNTNQAMCLNGSQRGQLNCILYDTEVVEVDLEVTNITVRKEK